MKHLGSKNTNYKLDSADSSLLDTFINTHPTKLYLVPFTQTRDEFSSLCPITRQPDFASMEVVYVPNKKMIESKSLKLYFFSFRNSGEFHEDVVNRIFKDLWNLLIPKYLRVFGNFAPRGGIAIKPIVEEYNKGLSLTDCKKIQSLVFSWDIKNRNGN